MVDGKQICENLFFSVACVSIFTCVIRSDYNFAMGLLGYYLIKNTSDSKISTTASSLLLINVLLIVMDILWCYTMSSVWSSKPSKNQAAWKGFDNIRSITMWLSIVNIILKGAACGFLWMLYKGKGK
mmetsp:Transcript_90107/g.124391  ORF Transcript_90107/g.124391 Transcript_90107/m.124391 type:complete len:127 (+) Transcript_90107:12-392(+)